ncbi:hypothetical protein B296_00041212 [Ensete ventricosum]|uniref:Uncharacterized protein n=1 Tax=Ensete ventricosum TaxID=4639 RepID=A0A426Z0D2_ENSVE|nr:hypothetical protein B296_00041212 [Ensete ventricosum]
MSGVERRKRPSLSSLPCFLGSPVSEHSDVPKQQSLCPCSEHKLAPWFSWSQPQKKRTRKKTSLAVDAPAAAAADRDGLFSKSGSFRGCFGHDLTRRHDDFNLWCSGRCRLAAGGGRRDRSSCTRAARLLKHSPSTATIRTHLIMTRIMIRNSSKIRPIHRLRNGLITPLGFKLKIQFQMITDRSLLCLFQRRSRESKHPNLDAGKKPAQLRRKPPDRSMLMASKPDRAGVLGPCAGLWVMALTMAVTLLSGPVAAAVCLFSCSYLLPLPRTMTTVVDGPAIAQAEVTGDSMEHKKRVILQGLLQRTSPRTITVCY